ncbi:beta-1,6-N-acetylglucosaminyltransferase [Paracoccus sp. (in: a-proteobacteria)]|uniref:DUF5927 domain-containing protein n=1 Tax=Paracoccus sp. TaxID=267 RepID=UPI0026DFE5E4|nr:beta-1,6-N-acetylglucosaminyltransferase [Paracoccus sp. (in: a-proteobacteria)]MDO5648882.1 beta-1,6-N-acetylglucosaminyltransferase [Paracoccus sp. (in: a-proteobacteria)]
MTVKLGVVMLGHESPDVACQLAKQWAGSGAKVVIHWDKRSNVDSLTRAFSDHDNVDVFQKYKCDWGGYNVVRATLDALVRLFQRFPDVTHVILVSGSCIPIKPIEQLRGFLSENPGRDFIESTRVNEVFWPVGGLCSERFEYFFPVSWRKNRRLFDSLVSVQRRFGVSRKLPSGLVPHMGSQWWCLTADTLKKILNDPRLDEYERFFRWSWIPDESFFQSLVRIHSQDVANISLTFVHFDKDGMPLYFYDDHVDILQVQWQFVARKVWRGAHELIGGAWLDRSVLSPNYDQNITQTLLADVDLARVGRPGLRMQGRFPEFEKTDAKTFRKYNVFVNVFDVLPCFDALSKTEDVNIYGHIFSEGEVDYGGSVAVGPGCLSSDTAIRDYDAESFFVSFVRAAGPSPTILYSPRDNQGIFWYLVQDVNADFLIVESGWIFPLAFSDMPFDDIRRAAAKFWSAERDMRRALESHWARAKFKVVTISDVLAMSGADWKEMMHMADCDLDVSDYLPKHEKIFAVCDFMRRLSRSGLSSEFEEKARRIEAAWLENQVSDV